MIRKRGRVRTHRIGKRQSAKRWKDSLTGVPAFLIGNAPSLEDVDLRPLKHKFTIGINRAFYKIDPTVLMWQDPELWYSEKHRIPKLEAIKFCRNKADVQGRFYHFKLTNGYFFLPERPDVLHGRGSTGPLAFQLAWCLGCDPIVLVGMDCKYSGGKTDFYGKNHCHKPHTIRNCQRGLHWIKKSAHGRRVISCSRDSVFDEHYSFDQAMRMADDKRPTNREYFVKRILGRG